MPRKNEKMSEETKQKLREAYAKRAAKKGLKINKEKDIKAKSKKIRSFNYVDIPKLIALMKEEKVNILVVLKTNAKVSEAMSAVKAHVKFHAKEDNLYLKLWENKLKIEGLYTLRFTCERNADKFIGFYDKIVKIEI